VRDREAAPPAGIAAGIRRAHRLDPLLAPASIALVGASTRPHSSGNEMVRMPRLAGFAGRLYPVNPAYPAVEGLRCHPSLASLPETVEHVVLGLANARLEAGLDEAIAHGARAVTVFASGHLDGDPDLGRRLGERARLAGIALCGGNGMGFYNLDRSLRVVAFDAPLDMRPGPIAYIAQSGSAFGALAHNDRRLGFNLAVSSGAEWATTAADYLDWALEQETTGAVGLFLETVRDPSAFVAGLEKAAARGIPVVVLKVGRTPESAAMALSHTGALAGSDAAYEALFDRHGVLRVDDEDELAATLLLLSHPRRPARGGLAAMHDSGGERELMVDLNAGVGVPFARLSPATAGRLAGRLDPGLAPVNPLDAWGTGANVAEDFAELMGALIEDPDAALGVLFADIRDGYHLSEKYAAAMLAAAARTEKPIAIASNYSLVRHEAIALRLTEAGVPVLDGTRNALRAVRHALAFRDAQVRREAPGASPLPPSGRDRWRARLAAGEPLGEAEALDLLDAYGIATPARRRAADRAAALAAAETVGWPVALKTAAPGIAHKSEAGGVRLGLGDAEALRSAYDDMAARLGPEVLVQAMAGRGVEAALGAVNDPDFGPYAMVAAGGVLIEILDDRAVSLAPIAAGTAVRMIARLRLARLLAGVRGAPLADAAALADALCRLSHLAADFADLIAEIDVNPVIVGPSGAVAVDALVVGRRPAAKPEGCP
jgi:acyl-CoA synthetase (NDP forming)